MISPPTIYLISGANRAGSIGFDLAVHILATHESAFVYAGTRNTDRAEALEELKNKYPGRVSIVKYIAEDIAGNAAMAKEIEERHGHVDTVIAAAGICNAYVSVADATVTQLNEHYQVNVVGPIVLFQAVRTLLKKSVNPCFVTFSSMASCISGGFIILPAETLCYETSKVALNWAMRNIHFENDWLGT